MVSSITKMKRTSLLLQPGISKIDSFIHSKNEFAKDLESKVLPDVLKKFESDIQKYIDEKITFFIYNLVKNAKASSDCIEFLYNGFLNHFQLKKKNLTNIQTSSVREERKIELLKCISEIKGLCEKALEQFKSTGLVPFSEYRDKLTNTILKLVEEVQVIHKDSIAKNSIHLDYSYTTVMSDLLYQDPVNGKLVFDYFLEHVEESDSLKTIDEKINEYSEEYKTQLMMEIRARDNLLKLNLEELKKELFESLEKLNYEFPEMRDQQVVDMYKKLEGKIIVNVVGDGHCLARTISYLIYGHQQFFQLVYEQMIKWLKDHGNQMDSLFKDFDISIIDILAHLNKIQHKRTLFMEDWPNNNVYLQIISDAFQVELELFYFEDFPKYTDHFIPRFSKTNKDRRMISIVNFRNTHYSPLEKIQ